MHERVYDEHGLCVSSGIFGHEHAVRMTLGWRNWNQFNVKTNSNNIEQVQNHVQCGCIDQMAWIVNVGQVK